LKITNKVILFAAVLLMAALFMPMTVYAVELDDVETPAVITETPEEPAGLGEAPVPLETPATSEPSISDGAFTPDGQAEVVDWVFGYDGKEFYSFKTPAGNVFYLIIDHARDNNNVYFLNAVTESDLIALAEKAGVPIGESAAPPDTTQKPPAGKENPGETEQPPAESEPPAKSGGMNTGMIIFLVIAALAVGGAGYYIKIVRPKQQAAAGDDEDDEPEDDDRDYPYEDDPDRDGADDESGSHSEGDDESTEYYDGEEENVHDEENEED